MQAVALAAWATLLWVSWLTCPLTGFRRLLSPTVQMAAMLTAIFALRPMLDERFQIRSFYGYVPTPAQQAASTSLGIAFAVAATLTLLVLHLGSREPDSHSNRVRGGSAELAAPILNKVELAVLGVSGTIAYAVVLTVLGGSGQLAVVVQGRSDAVHTGIPEFLTMLPLTGPLVVAYFLIQCRWVKISWAQGAVCAAVVLISAAAVAQLGTRRYLIPCLLVPVLASLVRKPVRISVVRLFLLGVVGFVLAAVPYVRAAGGRREGEGLASALVNYLSETRPMDLLYTFLASYDTEMFDFVAIWHGPLSREVGLGLGRGTVLEFVQRPFPNGFTPFGRPFSDEILSQGFRSSCADGVCPVASVIGVAAFDAGLAGVVLAGCVIAWYCWWLNGALMRAPSAGQMMAVRAVILSSWVIVLVRTNTVHATWWMLYTLLMAYGINGYAKRRTVSVENVRDADVAIGRRWA